MGGQVPDASPQDGTVKFESKSTVVLVPVLVRDSTPAANVPERSIVFLFDDLHLSAADLARAQKSATKLLDSALTGTDVAAVMSTSGRTDSGMIRDHGKLAEAIMSLREQVAYRQMSGQCPSVSFYQGRLDCQQKRFPSFGDSRR